MSRSDASDVNGEYETPTWRPSGVRRAVGSASDLLHRLSTMSDDDTRTPVYGVLAKVPVLVTTPERLRVLALDARARWVLPFIDGARTVELVAEATGVPLVDALLALCELVAREVIALRASDDAPDCA
jgi:hypothetical protein